MNRHDDHGTASLELVIGAPLLIVFFMFIAGLGRLALASQDVSAAAHDAARAASLTRTPGASVQAGKTAAEAALGDRGMSCANMTVTVDVSAYEPGGSVRAHVSCTARLSDLAMAGLPGSKTYTAEAVVPVEQYRAK